MRKTRKHKQKALIVCKTAVRVSPYVLIFLMGTYAIASNVKNSLDEQAKYKALAEQITLEPVVSTYVEDYDVEVNRPVEINSTDLLDSGYEFRNINFKELNSINAQSVGWIVLKDTVIDYPIVQGFDNQYYLSHDIEGNESSAGVIFQDVRDGAIGSEKFSDFNVLYGHHMKVGTMFASLSKYKNPDYVRENPYAVLYAEDGSVYKAEFFAGKVIHAARDNELYKYGFKSESDFDDFIQEIKDESLFKTDVDINYGDKILALVTCSYETDNARFVLYSKLSKQYTNYEKYESDINYNNSLKR